MRSNDGMELYEKKKRPLKHIALELLTLNTLEDEMGNLAIPLCSLSRRLLLATHNPSHYITLHPSRQTFPLCSWFGRFERQKPYHMPTFFPNLVLEVSFIKGMVWKDSRKRIHISRGVPTSVSTYKLLNLILEDARGRNLISCQ